MRDTDILYIASFVCQHCGDIVEMMIYRKEYEKNISNYSTEMANLKSLRCPHCKGYTERANADLDVYDPPIDFRNPNDKERIIEMIKKDQARNLAKYE